jgi:glycosyltransferase involved in cell wall biosynthesis
VRIGVDVTEAVLTENPKAGVYQYAFHLLREYWTSYKEHEYLLFLNSFRRRHYGKYGAFVSEVSGGEFKRRICRVPHKILRRWRLPIDLFVGRVDIFHGPFNFVPPIICGRSVVTVHDIAFKFIPEYLRADWVSDIDRYMTPSVRRADAIITISQFSKQGIAETFGIPEERIRVIYHGVSEEFTPEPGPTDATILQKMGVNRPYILFVGTLQPSKNVGRLLEAFAILKEDQKIGQRLVVVGERGWMYDGILKRYEELRLRDEVLFAGYVPNRDLPALYRGADLFVLPSVFESFGIPVLEAMACGTPVVASRACALPEITGGAGLLVNPESVEEMAHAIHRVLSDRELRERLRQQGLSRIQNLTWNETARKTMGVYRELHGSPVR